MPSRGASGCPRRRRRARGSAAAAARVQRRGAGGFSCSPCSVARGRWVQLQPVLSGEGQVGSAAARVQRRGAGGFSCSPCSVARGRWVQLQPVLSGEGQVLVELRPVEDTLLRLELVLHVVDDMEPSAQPRRGCVQHLLEALVDAQAGRARPLVGGVAARPAPYTGRATTRPRWRLRRDASMPQRPRPTS